jgi:hypothetical protein
VEPRSEVRILSDALGDAPATAPSRAGAGFQSETADQVAQALEDAGIDLVADLD